MANLDVQSRGGYVVLVGEVDPSEMDSVSNFVLGMRGVRGLDNSQLRARGSASGSASTGTGIAWAANTAARSAGSAGSTAAGGGQRSRPVPSQPGL